MKPIIVVGLLISGLVFTQDLELNTPEGSCRLVLNDPSEYMPEQGQLESSILIRNIMSRIDRLEDICSSKLKKSDRAIAMSLLDDLHFLIRLFPADYRVIIAPYMPAPQPPPARSMPEHDFGALSFRLKAEPFSDDQLALLRTAVVYNHFLVAQAMEILDVFSFEDDRLEAVRMLYPRILDEENIFRLYDSFVFSSSKEELAKILD